MLNTPRSAFMSSEAGNSSVRWLRVPLVYLIICSSLSDHSGVSPYAAPEILSTLE